MSGPKPDIAKEETAKEDAAPEIEPVEDDDEQSLPQTDDESVKLGFDEAQGLSEGSLAAGRATIVAYLKLAPSRPGVYRMIDARGDVLYVGKAKNIKKRIAAYARPTGLDTRIERMIAATRTLEFVVTRTETEALLLEANLIKRLRPRFNVTLRDDKSFPYIVITTDHWAPQISQAPRRTHAARPLLRPVCLSLGRQPHGQCLAARVPVALVQRFVFRKPYAAMLALSDQALLGAVHEGDRLSELCGSGARGECVFVGPQQGGKGRIGAGNGHGLDGARFRARGGLS